jgi:ribose-phosphate pyrophosphokinase
MKLFSGTTNLPLAQAICKKLKKPLGKIYHHRFASGELYCQYQENLRGEDIFVIQSISHPANDSLMQALLMADAARRASAKTITLVAPYFGYARQDRKDKSRVPISAKLVMNMIEAAGFDRVVTMDLHAPQIQGFTDLPVDHLYAMPVLLNYLKLECKWMRDIVIVAPDAGGFKRGLAYAEALNVGFAFIAKKRLGDTQVEAQGLTGDVKGKDVIIIDDLTESCGTLVEAAKFCKANGALSCLAAVSHGLLSEVAYERLRDRGCPLDFIIITDSVPNEKIHGILRILSVADLFAKVISRIHSKKSVTSLFDL